MQALNRVIDSVRPKRDDDVVDRANYIWTPLIASFLSLTIAAKQYVGEPLQCWIPAQFKKYWEEYAENYCFVENTYFVGMNETFPRTTEERQSRELHYYQWVSFILMGQVLFFILPKIIWSALNWKTGLNIRSLTQAALLTKKEKGAKTLKTEAELGSASTYIANVIRYNAECRPTRMLGTRNLWQNYVTGVYMLFKALNLLNSTGQLFLLNKFLGPQYTFWGWGILVDLVNGRNWQESGHFPR
ncbi:innexin unc-9, partial [Aphelenchoides avenae]